MANMHPVLENLKPFNKMDKDKAREIQSLGGKKSREVLKERKTIKEDLMLMLSMVMSNGKTTQENWMQALARNLLKGDMQTAVFVRDTVGEKPVDVVEQPNAVNSIEVKIVDPTETDKERVDRLNAEIINGNKDGTTI